MKPHKGYYSLIQFCPDASRLESINLGVILFCPALEFLEARTSTNTRRAEKLVGRGELARQALKLAQTAIEHRLRVDRESFQCIEDLKRFVETRGNALQLTKPRALKVVSPVEDLARLFDELVGGKANASPKTIEAEFPRLHSLFARLHEQGRAELDFHVKLPLLGQDFQVPFAYRNGVLNLVKPQRFSQKSPQQVLNLAIRGDLIYKHGLEGSANPRLVVVSSFEPRCDSSFVTHVDDLLEEYSVKHIRQSEIDSFASQVEQEAHA